VLDVREWDSNQKGDVAESAIRLAAARNGIGVYVPVNDHPRADMLFEIGGQVMRIQCKWARVAGDGSVLVVSTGTSRRSADGHVRGTYGEHEIDLLAAYSGEVDRAFLLPPSIFVARHQVQLRLTPSRNNQQACINLADDYDFDGAVAQLEERRHGMAEARGSSPLSSTLSSPDNAPARTIGCEQLRETLGQVIEQVAAGHEIIVTRREKPRLRMIPV
jgi:hypothetical protein